jgi:hypothetical protein
MLIKKNEEIANEEGPPMAKKAPPPPPPMPKKAPPPPPPIPKKAPPPPPDLESEDSANSDPQTAVLHDALLSLEGDSEQSEDGLANNDRDADVADNSDSGNQQLPNEGGENSDSIERLNSFLSGMEDIFQAWKDEIDFGGDEDIFSSAKSYMFSAIKLQEIEVEGLVIELDEEQPIVEPEVDFID